MKKLLNLFGKIRDDWYKHFAVSCVLACVLNLLIPYLIVIPLVLGIGIYKEIYDVDKSGFDITDICADALGIIIGIL